MRALRRLSERNEIAVSCLNEALARHDHARLDTGKDGRLIAECFCGFKPEQ
jgi:hypothetical protein